MEEEKKGRWMYRVELWVNGEYASFFITEYKKAIGDVISWGRGNVGNEYRVTCYFEEAKEPVKIDEATAVGNVIDELREKSKDSPSMYNHDGDFEGAYDPR